jgi:hypothetical protein
MKNLRAYKVEVKNDRLIVHLRAWKEGQLTTRPIRRRMSCPLPEKMIKPLKQLGF